MSYINKSELAADVRAYLLSIFPSCIFKSSWSLVRRCRKDWLEICYSGDAQIIDVIKQTMQLAKIRKLNDLYTLTVKKVD